VEPRTATEQLEPGWLRAPRSNENRVRSVRLKACETLPNCARVPIAFLWSEWGPLCHTLVNRFHCSIHYRVRYSAVQVLGNSWSQLPIARALVEDDRGSASTSFDWWGSRDGEAVGRQPDPPPRRGSHCSGAGYRRGRPGLGSGGPPRQQLAPRPNILTTRLSIGRLR
jgi:hypothetical protein